jgi:N-acetylglucosaminyl-diphospho-decaprenol L-rhamnosyltransferase
VLSRLASVDPAAPDVTVSIVNHENRDDVLRCLEALAEDAGRASALQVIVIDNASTDGSVEAIRGAFPQVEVIARTRRAGFGANHNEALRHATGRHVLLLNDDTRVLPGAIDTLARYLDEHERVAIAAPLVVDPGGAPQASTWPLPSLRGDLAGLATLGRDATRRTTPRGGRVGWALGCALMAPRAALERVGGFDERYFMYSEETDLSRRLADLGLETHLVPTATVEHVGQASTGSTPEPRAVEMARSRVRYRDSYYPPPARLAARAAIALQFGLLAGAAAATRRASAPAFLAQARSSLGIGSHPGLRELTDAWNRAHAIAQRDSNSPTSAA